MQKLMKRLHKNQKGFTLVELMVVVVIIGVLIAIAIPIFNAVTARAERGAIEANLRTIDGAIMMAITSEPTTAIATPATMQARISAAYLQVWPTEPGTYSVTGTDAQPNTYRASVNVAQGVGGLAAGNYTLVTLPTN